MGAPCDLTTMQLLEASLTRSVTALEITTDAKNRKTILVPNANTTAGTGMMGTALRRK